MTRAAPLGPLLLLLAFWQAACQEGCVVDDDGEEICPQPAMSALQRRATGGQKGLASEESEAHIQESEVVRVNSTTASRTHVAQLTMHGGAAKVQDSGLWVITVPDGCTNEDVLKMSAHMPAGSEAVFLGSPGDGGLCTFMMKGTKAMVLEELKTHTWPSNITVESDTQWAVVPELPSEEEEAVEHALRFWGRRRRTTAWPLDRLDSGRAALDDRYTVQPELRDGEGVHIYIFDTGIRTTHEDFEGRAVPTLDTTVGKFKVCWSWDKTCAYDRNGHGTHCAGSAGGKRWGVAKKSILHAVKVLPDKGGGSYGHVIKAVDWVMAHGQRPAVVSMSLGGKGHVHSVNIAIEKATNKGIAVVVAAGNDNDNACGYSPAYVPSAITVGATDKKDLKAKFSSWGSCVDIWAPGVDIEAPGHWGDDKVKKMSGTSMATPHVAGALALLYVHYPDMSGDVMEKKILAESLWGAVKGLGSDDHNRFLQVNVKEVRHVYILGR